MSVAGGLPRAVERAVVHGCEALQIFAKNASQWRGRTIPAEEVAAFRAAAVAAGLGAVVSHASYLINLASSDGVLRARSIEAMRDELDRAEALGLLGVVLHPGCATDGRSDRALTLIAEALLDVLGSRTRGNTMILLEQTAGQGTAVGARFSELARILDAAGGHPRLGVCLDTCHLLAAGYDLTTDAGYRETFDEFAQLIGFSRLRVVHVNDSKRPLGSRVDRHEHIGKGHVGLAAFERLINDPRMAGLPMLLETPKAEGKATGRITADPLDTANLNALRKLRRC